MIKNSKKVRLFYVVSISIVLVSGFKTASAEIYKCVKPEGTTYYIDKPCPVTDQETQFKAVTDPENGYIPSFKEDNDENKAKEGVVVGDSMSGEREGLNKKKSSDLVIGGGGAESQGRGNNGSKTKTINAVGKSNTDDAGGSAESSSQSVNQADIEYGEKEPTNVDELILQLGGPPPA